ncbi:glycoside hydrolase family 16 protein [Panacibacter ginsenosidivorans]|uniref:Glycoside hydrolase family 16 protein n=1 Tax=Panacibacter ginsenosidivorans TaxID=1813871 RepID=A0A5B8VE66_9BACT|nr:glycoside hydrolase family 16 protein [Panacibacter ginsenosidivorans]QEC69612.1 glycoside hydrolase family 16 protein [Panacibacter ginsenosidivorans]
MKKRHISYNALFALLCTIGLLSCKKQMNTTASQKADAAPVAENNTSVNATGICDYIFNESAVTAAGYTKVFEDNFDTDLSKWNIWTGGAFNNELEYYQAANMQLVNSNLVITAKKETVTGATTPFDATPKTFNYTSGRIECKTNISASTATPKVRIVARIKLPAGYGMWPAYWSYGDPWPTQGEIDYLEAKGQEPFKYQTNYFYGRATNRNLVKNQVGFITSNVDLTTCYHVYEMIWSQNSLTSLFDGNVVETKTGSYVPNLFGKTERITLNLAVGGNFFTNFNPALIATGSMYVDYVKVFTSN